VKEKRSNLQREELVEEESERKNGIR